MNISFNLSSPIYLTSNEVSFEESRRIAHHLFERAHLRAQVRRLVAKLTGRNLSLHSLAHAPVYRQSQRSSRVTYIPLKHIKGSEGRSEDFDDQFNPLKTHNLERWIGIVVARHSCIALPPVELVRDGDDYYVRDGHHRISVAKALGQIEIEAVIVN